jgi:hypothetical protein
MISACISQAASAVARLTAVVVFPTPPFWFATAMTVARRFFAELSAGTV